MVQQCSLLPATQEGHVSKPKTIIFFVKEGKTIFGERILNFLKGFCQVRL